MVDGLRQAALWQHGQALPCNMVFLFTKYLIQILSSATRPWFTPIEKQCGLHFMITLEDPHSPISRWAGVEGNTGDLERLSLLDHNICMCALSHLSA